MTPTASHDQITPASNTPTPGTGPASSPSPLHPVTSLNSITSQTTPAMAPIEPHTAAGPSMIHRAESRSRREEAGQLDGEQAEEEEEEEHRFHLVFKRLRREMPLPSPLLRHCMLATLFWVMILAGWNDASQGPLLPSLQNHFNVNYLIISLIWIGNFVGFMTSGITNVFLTDRLGFGIAAPFGSAMQGLGYILMASGGPYPLFVVAYVINGFGLGLQDAQCNSMTSRLPSANTKMFLLHAFYGLGATISPLVATEFVKKVQDKVYLYFWVSLGLAGLTIAALVLVFRFRTEDQVVGKRVDPLAVGTEVVRPDAATALRDVSVSGSEVGGANEKSREPTRPQPDQSLLKQSPNPRLPSRSTGSATQDTLVGEGTPTHATSNGEKSSKSRNRGSGSKMKRIMTTPAVHFLAIYICIYVGIEVTLGGWITSFLLTERSGDDNSGYVTTGYFAGITIGRVVLIPVTTWIGKHNSIYIYSILAIALEILVWTIDSLPANGVFFALVGILLGPMYPIVMMAVIDILPGELQAGSIGWIASLGQAGSAIMPFITGAIADKHGVWILQPLTISLLGFSLVLWWLVPRPKGIWV